MADQQHRLVENLGRRPSYASFPKLLGGGFAGGMLIGGLLTLGLFEVLGLGVTGNRVFFAAWLLVALLIAIVFTLGDVANRMHSKLGEQWDENLLLRKEIARLDADHDLLSLRMRLLSESRPGIHDEISELRKSMRELQREVSAVRSRRLDG